MSALREALQVLPDAVFADAFESEDAYLLVVDVPGVTEDTVDVTVEGRRLRVEARREKPVPGGFTYRSEERSLFVDFEVPLPPDAADRVDALAVERGVLELTVPKRRATGRDVPVESVDEVPSDADTDPDSNGDAA